MTETNKRFIRTIGGEIYDSENDSFVHQDYVGKPIEYEDECIKLLNELHDECEFLKIDNEALEHGATVYAELYHKSLKENEQLKEENNKLHTKIFEMRTNIALERTEISRQTYTGKKNEKEYLDAKEFLDEIEKW